MRLDKYLKVSRLLKRRTVANDACDAGRIFVNGKPSKASYEIKPGDVIALNSGSGGGIRVRVESVANVIGKSGAADLYTVLPQV